MSAETTKPNNGYRSAPLSDLKIIPAANEYRYSEMLMEKNIPFHSCGEHHFVSITGKVHIAYISKTKIILSSDLYRLVEYHGSKPQVQERLIEEIAFSLKEYLNTQDVAVIIDAAHSGRQVNSSRVTAHYSGKFQNEDKKREFFQYLNGIG